MRPGPSAVGGPRGNAISRSNNNSASNELKARLYTGAGGQSAQALPGTLRASKRMQSSRNRNGVGGRTRGKGLVARKTMRGSRSTPALVGFGRTNQDHKLLQMPGLQANNFLPGVSEKTDAPSAQKSDTPIPPSAAATGVLAAARTSIAEREPGGGIKRDVPTSRLHKC